MKGILFKPEVWQGKLRAFEQFGYAETRRLDHLKEINKEPNNFERPIEHNGSYLFLFKDGGFDGEMVKPRYHAGETVYIKEGYVPNYFDDGKPAYRNDWDVNKLRDVLPNQPKWVSAMFLPEKFARHFIKITDVYPGRLQDITEEGALAEGIVFIDHGKDQYSNQQNGFNIPEKAVKGADHCLLTARFAYWNLWNKINGKGSWESNPWVWVIRFSPLKADP